MAVSPRADGGQRCAAIQRGELAISLFFSAERVAEEDTCSVGGMPRLGKSIANF